MSGFRYNSELCLPRSLIHTHNLESFEGMTRQVMVGPCKKRCNDTTSGTTGIIVAVIIIALVVFVVVAFVAMGAAITS